MPYLYNLLYIYIARIADNKDAFNERLISFYITYKLIEYNVVDKFKYDKQTGFLMCYLKGILHSYSIGHV